MTKQVDVLVIGGGAAGMTAALTAKREGLDVVLCEKAPYVGGITATSGGTTWVPGTHLSDKAGVPDKVDDARTFLSHVCAGRGGDALREAFLVSGPEMIRELDEHTDVKFVAATAHPDYIGNVPGEAYGGRALAPVPFEAAVLGKDFDRVRPPRREFMGLGGMMVNRSELDALLNPFKSADNFKTTMKVVLPYFKDRLKYKRGTRLVMGNALVGRLYYSLVKHQVPVWFESPLVRLLVEEGKVVGAVVKRDGVETEIRARKGVVLATGGVGHNAALREQFFPKGTPDFMHLKATPATAFKPVPPSAQLWATKPLRLCGSRRLTTGLTTATKPCGRTSFSTAPNRACWRYCPTANALSTKAIPTMTFPAHKSAAAKSKAGRCCRLI